MQRMFRPLAVFSIASGASLAAALQLAVGGAQGSDGPARFGASSFFPGYDIAKLELVEPTLYHIDESYVDPSRIDWEQMYVAALDAIERRVPVAMFSREPGGGIVSVEIGEYRTVLEVPPIEGRSMLQDQLRDIAVLLKDHLGPEDVPVDDQSGGSSADPLAQVEYALINGMLSTLDPHSVLLPPDDAHEMDLENQGEFGGLGIQIEVDGTDGRLTITCPIEGTPADRAGLEADDHIVRIDGESTVNLTLDEAVTRLRGPVGAEVDLEVARADEPVPTHVKVRRELIAINPVEGRLLDGAIGYVKITGFHEQVERDLHDILSRLNREGGETIRGLVIDLRGNPGGFLNQAVKVADTFLESGDIVSTVDRQGRRADHEQAHRSAEPPYPIVVLVDANSASASEIVAGALRYNERAVILGERTFGKGSVQNLHPFYDDSKLKLTISKYLTPGDRSLQAVGIPADIELQPAVVPSDPKESARVFHRERARREADLDHSLERVTTRVDRPAYEVRYLESAGQSRTCGGADVASEPQVQLARDVLMAATGPRRSDVLIAASTVITRRQRIGNEAIAQAFSARGIDWRDGPPAAREDAPRSVVAGPDTQPRAVGAVEVTLDLGADGRLVAGTTEALGVTVKNTSARPLYRVAAILSGVPLVEGRELFFGAVPPGESRRSTVEVTVPDGWPAERASLSVELRDTGEGPFATLTRELDVQARALPAFAWRWSISDEAKGDGDGILDLGETVDLELEVRNVGEGPSAELYARLHNRSRKAVDLVEATLLPGEAVDELGAACAVEGSRPGDPLPAGCHRVLQPGRSWTGRFRFQVKEALPDGAPLEVELALGDASAYDQATVVRGEFYEWFGQRERISVVIGEPLPGAELRRPPTIDITRAPESRIDGGRMALSGVVTDDRGLAHVMVYVGDDKVFFEGGGPTSALRSLPFTADVALEAGSNLVTVLATDDQGFVASRSVVTSGGGSAVAQVDDSAQPAPTGSPPR
jgi:carboxyl-terminal processing protease